MSLSRHLLLRASRSPWLARQLSERAFFRRAVRRFMPGEDLDAALAAAADLARDSIGSVLTQLGEQVTSRDEAAGVRDHYLRVLEEIRQRQLPTEISVKLTHLGLDLNPRACLQDLLARPGIQVEAQVGELDRNLRGQDRKSTRLNSSHTVISY